MSAPDGTREFVAFAVEYLVLTLGEDHPTIRVGRRIVETLAATPEPTLDAAEQAVNHMPIPIKVANGSHDLQLGWAMGRSDALLAIARLNERSAP